MKKTLILQCPGMVCSPPVVSKCLGEAHRRLDIIYIIYITLHYITLQYITLILFFLLHTVGNFSTSCIELSPYPLCRHFLLGLVYKFNAHLNVMSKFGTV